MSNFVSNRIICSKEVYQKYLEDHYSFGKYTSRPYISFRKILNDDLLRECDEHPYTAFGKEIIESNGMIDLRFQTRSNFPIRSIAELLAMEHQVIWYVAEDNRLFVTRFTFNDGIAEEIRLLDSESDFEEYMDLYCGSDGCEDLSESLSEADDIVWHFQPEKKKGWVRMCKRDIISLYEGSAFNAALSIYKDFVEMIHKETKNGNGIWM